METGLLSPLGRSAPVINPQDEIWGEAGAVGAAGDAAPAQGAPLLEEVCTTQLQHNHCYGGSPVASAPAIPHT